MFDEDASNLLAYQQARLKDVGATKDMEALPAKLGCTVRAAGASRLIGTEIHLRRTRDQAVRHSEIAHEVSHKLAQERATPDDPNYEEVIRYRHAHAHNVEAHLESIITTGQDRIRMPHDVVEAVIRIVGLNAMAVWVLHQQEGVMLHEALRRLVHHNENARIGGFIARRGLITHAYSYRWRMPVWVGHPMPDGVNDDFGRENSTLFEVPGLPETHVGLIVVEEG